MTDFDPTLLIEGAQDALIGYVRRCGHPTIAIYDHQKLVDLYMAQDMSEEEALDYIECNVVGAWVGEGTPGVLVRGSVEDIEEFL